MPKTKKTKIEKAKKEKKSVKKKPAVKTATVKSKPEKYFEGLGRRKTAVARVRLFAQKAASEKSELRSAEVGREKKEKSFLINGRSLEEYFPIKELQQTVFSSLDLMDCLKEFKVSVKVKGGGVASQAEAIRHGIARALVLFNPNFRRKLKKAGYLKRDPRMRERKKFGLKRARRAPQWSKR